MDADSELYDLVIGIQVFQHGDRRTTHALLRRAKRRLAPGGLFCLRVNAVGTDLWPEHEETECHGDGGHVPGRRPGRRPSEVWLTYWCRSLG